MCAVAAEGLAVPEVLDLYRRSGLGPFALPDAALRQTWQRLLDAQPGVFRIDGRRDDDGALAYSASAFAYATGTWHAQHLVSGERDDRAGAVAVLEDIVRALEKTDAHSIRATFTTSGAFPFFAAAHRVASRNVSLSLADYGVASMPPAAGIEVQRVTDPEPVVDFYADLLHPAELQALDLRDLELLELDERYRRFGLRRTRTVFAAFHGPRVVGACVVNRGPAGTNHLGLESAIEHLRVERHLSGPGRARIWNGLLRAAVGEHGRAVALLDPDDRPLATAAGIKTRRIVVATAGRDGDSFVSALRKFR
jgi:hypothetical protein